MDNNTLGQITIEYERTIDEITEFNLFHMSHSPSARQQILIAQIFVASLVFLVSLAVFYLLHQENKVLPSFKYIVALVASVVCFFAYPAFHRSEVIREFRKATREGDNRSILGHHTITLTQENIFIKAPGGASTYTWSSINKVAQNDKYVFLYVSSINAIVIPKNAFSGSDSLQEFLDYVNACCEQKLLKQ